MLEEETKVVSDILNSNEFKYLVNEDIVRIIKTNDVSRNTRQLGNTRFKEDGHHSGVHENIIQLYSLAIAIANPKSEELAIAYGNRSAMMIHLWMYKNCITDIDRALKITNDNLLKIKLLCRKAKCLSALGLTEKKKSVMEQAEILFDQVKNDPRGKTFADLVSKTKLSLKEQVKLKNFSVTNYKKLERVKDLQRKHEINDFSLVDIKYNAKYGRHLIAKRDIHPGEIIFIEKPYLHCVDLSRGYTFCFHCLTSCLINIPCDHCSWAMYCSKECKQKAWKEYHHVECSVYAYAKQNVDGEYGDSIKHLAVKSLICGISKAGGIDQLRADLESFDKCPDTLKGFVENGKIQSCGFKSIYALLSNTSDKKEKLHKTNTMKVLKSLAMNTTYFGKTPSYEKTRTFREDDNVLFVGSLVYKLSRIFQLNSRAVPSGRDFCTSGLDVRQCENKHCCTAGIYIAPISSLLNHSCTPNVKRCFSSNYSVIVYAVQPIKKGSQLFDCYQQEFYEHDTLPRQKHLKKRYNFECDCAACNDKWSIVEYDVTSKRQLKRNPAEAKLADEYLQLIKLIQDKKIEVSEMHVDILSRGLKKACSKKLSQPSFMTTNLIRGLNALFRSLYGIEISIPDKCNKA